MIRWCPSSCQPHGSCLRRRAHHRDPVEPLAVVVEVLVIQLAQRVVEPHDVARLLHALGAECGAQQGDGRLALGLRHLLEARALPEIEVLVHPLAPFRVVHRKHRRGTLLWGQRGEEHLGGLADGRGRDAGRAEGEEPWDQVAVGRDPLKRLGQPACFGLVRQASGALAALTRRLLREGGVARCHDTKEEEQTEEQDAWRRGASRVWSACICHVV